MNQKYMLQKSKKMAVTKKLIEEVVRELVPDEEALDIVFYLKGKKRISEFIIAEELDLEIHKTRQVLYKLYEHNIVSFLRKKDKIKGWYICYWDLNESMMPELSMKLTLDKINQMEERLKREQSNTFFMCKNACVRMNFDDAIEYNFKCPECGSIMNEQDNERTKEFLSKRIGELKETTSSSS